MTDSNILPGVRGRLVDGNGRPTPEFYDFFRNIVQQAENNSGQSGELLDEIREIAIKLGSPDGSVDGIPDDFIHGDALVLGLDSIQSFGNLSDGKVFLNLVNDDLSPNPVAYYGTDTAKAKGWQRIFNTLLAGLGLAKKMDGFTITGEVGSVGGLPSPGAAGDVYLVGPEIYSWDGAAWNLEGAATGLTTLQLSDDFDNRITLTSGSPISALRVIVDESGVGRYPDTSVSADAGKVVGISVTSGTTFDVAIAGEIEDNSWSWSPGIIWCGADGVLTQTQPAAGWVLEVGRSLTPTRIQVSIKVPFVRA